MANKNENAYGLTVLCPIKPGERDDGLSHIAYIKTTLEALESGFKSPMATVPQTYLARFFVLDDVFYEGKPATEEHLKSAYLVFSSNFHGELESYLLGMWEHLARSLFDILESCVGFKERVNSGPTFAAYIKDCQVPTTFFFNGSNDRSPLEQLKSLYLKQEFSKFVYEHQMDEPDTLQRAFETFMQRVRAQDVTSPTWRPGAKSLREADVGEGPADGAS